MDTFDPSPQLDKVGQFSYSVKNMFEQLSEEKEVRSLDIVVVLLKLHPKYGGESAEGLISLISGPSMPPFEGKERKPVWEWLAAVKDLYMPDKVPEIHTRLVTIGLTLIDKELRDFLNNNATGFVEVLKAELKEPFNDLLRKKKPPADPAHTHPDTPSAIDLLGRQDFAEALSLRLRNIWKQSAQNREGHSFVMHLHGPWGSGKTSLLNFIQKALQRSEGGQNPWVVVWFNAWQHQHITPSWWALYDCIYREAARQWREDFKDPKFSKRIRNFEWLWRIRTGRLLYVAGFIVSLLVALLLLGWFLVTLGGDSHPIDETLKALGAAVGLIGAVWSAALFITRSLTSAGAAEEFVRFGEDPLGKVKRHFQELVEFIGRPIIVFIDDLDRCCKEYAVNLLENLQTLFTYHKIFFVVSGDRRWLYTCFEKVYQDFQGSIKEPGRRLGYLFLEKAFQLSVSVPSLTPEVKEKYLEFLQWADSNKAQEGLEESRQEAQKAFRDLEPTEVYTELEKKEKETGVDSLQKQAYRGAAVRQLATPQAEWDKEYFLKPFGEYLESNPRAMKRFVNAYKTYLDLAILGNAEVVFKEESRKQLALWTIITLRWPALAEYLELHCEQVNDILSGSFSSADENLSELTKEMKAVKEVFDGKKVKVSLDSESLGRLLRIKTSVGGSTVVA